jgi:hypothetical protein
MTRIYENPGYLWRQRISMVVMIIVGVYGIWELWSAAQGQGDTTFGYMFGIVFVGGAAFALQQIIADGRDLIALLDRDDASGELTATLWRPFSSERVVAEPGQFTGWRLHIKIGKRNARSFFVYADHPRYPRPLQFDLRSGVNTDGLRTLAPEAIDEFETAVGAKKGDESGNDDG